MASLKTWWISSKTAAAERQWWTRHTVRRYDRRGAQARSFPASLDYPALLVTSGCPVMGQGSRTMERLTSLCGHEETSTRRFSMYALRQYSAEKGDQPIWDFRYLCRSNAGRETR